MQKCYKFLLGDIMTLKANVRCKVIEKDYFIKILFVIGNLL